MAVRVWRSVDANNKQCSTRSSRTAGSARTSPRDNPLLLDSPCQRRVDADLLPRVARRGMRHQWLFLRRLLITSEDRIRFGGSFDVGGDAGPVDRFAGPALTRINSRVRSV